MRTIRYYYSSMAKQFFLIILVLSMLVRMALMFVITTKNIGGYGDAKNIIIFTASPLRHKGFIRRLIWLRKHIGNGDCINKFFTYIIVYPELNLGFFKNSDCVSFDFFSHKLYLFKLGKCCH